MYKTTISIEKQLQKIASENHEYNELWATWNLNKKTLEPILSAIIKDYPHYSLHDHSHSESILLNIERILGNNNIEKLSPTDLWLLLHVSYLHDFGMVILDSKINEFWSKHEFQDFLIEQSESTDVDAQKAANIILKFGKNNEEYCNTWPLDIRCAVTLLISIYCRWQHATYSSDYILDLERMWGIDLGHNGLIKKRFISLLADISEMHTKQFEEIFTLPKEANGFKNDYMHPRLIACLLRVGDVLDLDNSRFNKYGEKIFGKMPGSSKIHYDKHEATKHVLITNEVIEVEADCPTDEIYRETRKWYDSLKNEFDNLHLNWNDIATNDFSHPPKLKPYKILRNGVEDPNELSNLKFSISQSKAFEIIEGSSIYKDKFSCIREIVQNAEDATKIQLWRDIKSGMYYSDNAIDKYKVENNSLLPSDIPEWIYNIYSIQITIEENEEHNAVLSVVDHGTGISIDTLKSICNVGQSYFQKQERKREIEEMPVWLRPTANFGIGLQSCFMVTDKITIFTNSSKDGAYKLTFKSGKQEGYVNVESTQDFNSRGSKVVIEIKNGLNFSYDMFGFTAQKLSEVEPFESNCIIIYKIIDSIFNECNESFFEINVISNSCNFSEKIYPCIYNNKFPKDVLIDTCLYYFDSNTGSITFWYDNNLYTISICKNSYENISVKFKGKQVHKHINRIWKGFCINVDLYGYTTKEALSLNREELNRKIIHELCKSIEFLIENYINFLINNAENIQENTDIVDTLLLTSWCYKKIFPKSLFNKVSISPNIRVLKLTETDSEIGFKPDFCSLHDLVSQYPYIPYVNCEIHPNKRMGYHILTEDELINILSDSDYNGNQNGIIIIDNTIRNFLASEFCDITYLKTKKDVEICMVSYDDILYNPDEHTKAILIKKLVYTGNKPYSTRGLYITRRAIPAFKEFEKLAVNVHYLQFIGIEEYAKWNIISPISLNDSKKISTLPKDAFVEYIINQPLFEKIVQYVLEHGKITSNKETIICEYKKLIECYYDIAKGSK